MTPPEPPVLRAASVYNVANLLTLIRIALVPLLVWLMFCHGLGWRIVSPMFDRERLITGTR